MHEKLANRRKPGTLEHLWNKWLHKLYSNYPTYAHSGTGEPPSAVRHEFYQDVELVLEHRIAEMFPQHSVLQKLD